MKLNNKKVIKLEGVDSVYYLELQVQLCQLEAMNPADYNAMWKDGLSQHWKDVAEGFIKSNQNPEDKDSHSQQYEAKLQGDLQECIDSIEPDAPSGSYCSVQ